MKRSFLVMFVAILTQAAAAQFLSFSKTYGGPNNEYLGNMAATSDGGYLLVGSTGSFGPNASAEIPNGLIVKTDFVGEQEWSLVLGGTGSDWFSDVVEKDQGGFLVVGSVYAPGSFTSGYISLVSLSEAGEVMWTKRIGTTGRSESPGRIIAIGNDEYVIVGSSSLNSGSDGNMLALSINGDGDVLWASEFGGPPTENARDVIRLNDGGYLVAGLRFFPANVQLVKLDAGGNYLWERTYSDLSTGMALASTDDGILMNGGLGSDAFLMRMNAEAEIIWTRSYTYDWNLSPYSVNVLADGQFLIGARTTSPGSENYHSALIRIDENGAVINAARYGGEDHNASIRSMVVEQDGGITWAGSSMHSNGSSFEDLSLTRTGAADMGSWAACAYGSIELEAMDHTDLSFTSIMTQQLPPILTVTNLSWSAIEAGEENTLCSTVGVGGSDQSADGVTLFPNPSNGRFFWNWKNATGPITVEVVDVTGRIVHRTISSRGKEVVLPALKAGLYHCRFTQVTGVTQVTTFRME